MWRRRGARRKGGCKLSKVSKAKDNVKRDLEEPLWLVHVSEEEPRWLAAEEDEP